TRERWAGPCGVAESLAVPGKPGISGGGKGPHCNVQKGRCVQWEADPSTEKFVKPTREQETEPCKTGLRRRRESFVSSHRETKATAPVLDSTRDLHSLARFECKTPDSGERQPQRSVATGQDKSTIHLACSDPRGLPGSGITFSRFRPILRKNVGQ